MAPQPVCRTTFLLQPYFFDRTTDPMAQVSLDQLRQRFEAMAQRRKHFEWKAEQPGRLARHEVWRHAYLAKPYLIGADDDRLAQRFRDVFINVMEVEQNGKLGPVWLETDEFTQLFTHLLEEYGARSNGLPADLIEAARAPLFRYFEHGAPLGFTMFQGYSTASAPVLVKYGRREFLEPMFRSGVLRLSNAKSYNNASFTDAARDDETRRTFVYPTYKERLKGQSSAVAMKHTIEFGDNDFELPLIFDDYYLFSTCDRIHHRMPTDFNADAAIVIRDPKLFIKRLVSSFLAGHSDWFTMHGKVTYYDPYRDYTKFRVPEMAKHFRYAYQKEFRVAFRPRHRIVTKLEPLFLSIGPMIEYADLLPA